MHVKGHATSNDPNAVGNNGADTLAVRGCYLDEEIEDDWDALRVAVEEETNMIRDLRVNGTSVGMGGDAGVEGRKIVRQSSVEVEDEEANVVKEIMIRKDEFDPRVSEFAESSVQRC